MSLSLWEYFWTESDWAGAAGPAIGSLLLLGVGRAWWFPWAGWLLLMGSPVEAASVGGTVWVWWELLASMAGATLGGFAIAWVGRRRALRRERARWQEAERALSELRRERIASAARRSVAGVVRGAAAPRPCLACGALAVDGVELYNGDFLGACCRSVAEEGAAP